MSLPGRLVERLEAALLDAFTDDEALDLLIRRVGMQTRVPARAALSTRVGKLVEVVDAHGLVVDLLDAARDLAPGNAALPRVQRLLLAVAGEVDYLHDSLAREVLDVVRRLGLDSAALNALAIELPPALRDILPTSRNPLARVDDTFWLLRAIAPLADGSVPLARWLAAMPVQGADRNVLDRAINQVHRAVQSVSQTALETRVQIVRDASRREQKAVQDYANAVAGETGGDAISVDGVSRPTLSHREGNRTEDRALQSLESAPMNAIGAHVYELGRVTADLVILTVLPEEYAAVLACLRAPTLIRGSTTMPNVCAWQLGTIDASHYGAPFKVVLGMGTPTTTFGALAASEGIRLFDPRYIAFVGVAGGFDRDGQRHGDVAVSSVVTAYEYGKVDTGGFAPRGNFTYRCNEALVRASDAARATGARWWRDDDNQAGPPSVRTGMIASGDKVIDDPDEEFFAAVRTAWPKLLAVEMEGAGVAAAVHEVQGHRAVGLILVRGISDMPHRKAADAPASTQERDGWKVTASRNAARFLTHLVATAWPVPPRSGTGTVAYSIGSAQQSAAGAATAAPASHSDAADVDRAADTAAGNSSSTQRSPPSSRPVPVYPDAEVEALSKRAEDIRARRDMLRAVGMSADHLDREYREVRGQLREGGRFQAGDSVGDGRYLLVRAIGRGGYAVVWEAYDCTEQQRVAIKVLHANLAGDLQRRERFFRGAKAMRKLVHPAVVRVLEPEGKDGGFYYFVMEFVPSGNLRDAVLAQRVKRDAVLSITLQVGEALALAHSRGIIHRDIKPANILLDEQDNGKLTDFDLVGTNDSTGGTGTGALGTVLYAAPECLHKPHEATTRADVFGLGMTVIFCLSGQDLTMDTLLDRAAALAQLDCSVSVKKVLERAVEWQPDRRFADAAAMADALRDALAANRSTQATPVMIPRRTQPPPPIAASPVSIETAGSLRTDPSADPSALLLPAPKTTRWVVASGRDDYGLWAAFDVSGMHYRMRWILPGAFVMGSPETEAGRFRDEGPQHEVTLTRGYWLGETPVTQALWVAVMGANPSRFVSGDRPVEQVSWDDCQQFIDRLNRKVDGLETRLPTEAEWERACRAGTTAATWIGDLTLRGANDAPELDAIAWYGGNSGVDFELEDGVDSSSWPQRQHPHARAGTHPVGRKAPNPYGLYDMLGNVCEWCADGVRRYVAGTVTDPVGGTQGADRVLRGGSWNYEARGVRLAARYALSRPLGDIYLDARVMRAAYRCALPRGSRGVYLGFRLARGQQSAPDNNPSRPEMEPRSGDQGRSSGRDTSQAGPPSASQLPSSAAATYVAARLVGEMVGDVESARGAALLAAAAAGAAIEVARARASAGAPEWSPSEAANRDPVPTVRVQRDQILRALAEDIAATSSAPAPEPPSRRSSARRPSSGPDEFAVGTPTLGEVLMGTMDAAPPDSDGRIDNTSTAGSMPRVPVDVREPAAIQREDVVERNLDGVSQSAAAEPQPVIASSDAFLVKPNRA